MKLNVTVAQHFLYSFSIYHCFKKRSNVFVILLNIRDLVTDEFLHKQQFLNVDKTYML